MNAQTNDSGFHGYQASTLYPGWGNGVDQNQETIMEPAEQAVVSDVGKLVEPAVHGGSKKNIWIALGVIVAFVLFSSKG